jgi:formiminotetrahydrofolate cyclodeaminase
MIESAIEDIPARSFNRMIADPDIFCGGGSVAALAGAGAAATALLVMRLNAKRRSNAAIRGEIEELIIRTDALIEKFYRAADADIQQLQVLLDAQRALKHGGDRDSYAHALVRAAESPIEVAELVQELLETIKTQLDISTRFTVSDLGAAAVLADGCCRAALLTAEVNIALLAETEGVDVDVPKAMAARSADLHEHVVALSLAIEQRTRDRLRGSRGAEAGACR